MKDGERGWVNRISSSLKSQWKSFFRNGKIFFRSFQSLPLGFLHINNINNIHSCCLLEFDTRVEICCLRFIFFGWNWQHEFIEEFLLYYLTNDLFHAPIWFNPFDSFILLFSSMIYIYYLSLRYLSDQQLTYSTILIHDSSIQNWLLIQNWKSKVFRIRLL